MEEELQRSIAMVVASGDESNNSKLAFRYAKETEKYAPPTKILQLSMQGV